MAGNDKLFVVKNGLRTQNIEYLSPDRTNTITLEMLDSDTLSWEGDSGQLFSITDSLTGTIFSVNDISGIPSIEVDDDGTIRLAEFAGNVLVGTNTDDGTNKLQVSGSASFTSSVTASSFSGSLNYSDITNPPTIGNAQVSVSGGNALTGSGSFNLNDTSNSSITINHADTSTQGSVNNSGGTVVQDIGLDGYGHVTSIGSKSLSPGDIGALSTTGKAADSNLLDGEDSPYYLNYNNFTNTPTIGNGTLTVSGGSAINASGTFDANQTTNTTITVDHADTSSQGSVNNSGSTVIQDVTLDGFGHVTGLASKTITGSDVGLNNATITINAGAGLTTGGAFTTNQGTNETITIDHADTSTQGDVNTSGGTIIDNIFVDGYGHITSIGTRSLDSRYLQSESDTLDSVTDRGNSTPNTISAGEVESDLFFRNKDTVSTNQTVPADGYNSMSVGPITITDGTTITVQDGARWVVI